MSSPPCTGIPAWSNRRRRRCSSIRRGGVPAVVAALAALLAALAGLLFAAPAGAQDGPTIELVRIVSAPSHDANGDGAYDTYIRGDRILVDVEFSEPVRVAGGALRLRLDLGPDDADPGNSRIVLSDYRDVNGMLLRFEHRVRPGNADPDGVWVQTGANGKVLFLGTVVSAETGAAADLTLGGLPTSGDARHRVDGSVTGVAGPRPLRGTANGATVTVTFDKALDGSVNRGDLRYALEVRGTDMDAGSRVGVLHPSAVSVRGATVTLSLGLAARPGQMLTVSYEPADDGVLKDAGGNEAPPFREFAVTNVTGGTAGEAVAPPAVASAAGGDAADGGV